MAAERTTPSKGKANSRPYTQAASSSATILILPNDGSCWLVWRETFPLISFLPLIFLLIFRIISYSSSFYYYFIFCFFIAYFSVFVRVRVFCLRHLYTGGRSKTIFFSGAQEVDAAFDVNVTWQVMSSRLEPILYILDMLMGLDTLLKQLQVCCCCWLKTLAPFKFSCWNIRWNGSLCWCHHCAAYSSRRSCPKLTNKSTWWDSRGPARNDALDILYYSIVLDM